MCFEASSFFICLFSLGFWFLFCPRQLTTNYPILWLKAKQWVKGIPYGLHAEVSETMIKTRPKSEEETMIHNNNMTFYWCSDFFFVSHGS